MRALYTRFRQLVMVCTLLRDVFCAVLVESLVRGWDTPFPVPDYLSSSMQPWREHPPPSTMAADGSHPSVPHFHSVDQMLESIKDGVRVVQIAHLSCTEPMLISLQVASPTGERLTLATASAQPSRKQSRKSKDGQGGFHACHLFKHVNAGIMPFLKDLLRRDHELKSALVASPQYSLSKKGNRITHSSLLAESLADKIWSDMSTEEKLPWKAAAVSSHHTCDGVDWSNLATTARRCKTVVTFVARLYALVGMRTAGGKDEDGVPSIVKLLMK